MLLLLFFSNELSFVVLTQSWGWSYSCVSFNDEGLQGGKIASEKGEIPLQASDTI